MTDSSLDGRTVAVLGGTGPQGRGLARRWATAGIPPLPPRRPRLSDAMPALRH